MNATTNPSTERTDKPGTQRRILVATEGGAPGAVAVEFAAAEAARRGLDLQILHVMPAYLPYGPLPMAPNGVFEEDAHEVLTHAVSQARAAEPHLEIAPTAKVGGRVGSIVSASEDVELTVIGRTPGSLAHRLMTGATAAGVTARSSRPVVVVPDTWEAGTKHGRVIVGLKSSANAHALLARAFEEASRTESELAVIHAWWLPGRYADLVVDEQERAHWQEQTTKEYADALEDLRREYPWVNVRVEAIYGQPAHELVELSRSADRLLISRPAHGGNVHHLGATARAVLREAHCPVEVVPPATELAAS